MEHVKNAVHEDHSQKRLATKPAPKTEPLGEINRNRFNSASASSAPVPLRATPSPRVQVM